MNTIRVYNDHILETNIDETINVNFISKNEMFHVNKIQIEMIKDSALQIEYSGNTEVKLDIEINLLEGVHGSIGEMREGKENKIRYIYFLKQNSTLETDKFYHSESIKEQSVINLEGKGAYMKYRLKTIGTGKEKYDTVVYHHAKETICMVDNHAISHQKGQIEFQMTNTVNQGIKDCVIRQNSRIITLNNNKCVIKPILLIDENDVTAEHAAHIGRFDMETLFYLQSRGLSSLKAEGLLIRGFLTHDVTLLNIDKINRIINTYWR